MTETAKKDLTKTCMLPSGATLHLGRPPFRACADLRNALARAAAGRPFTPEEMKLGLDALKDAPSAGGALMTRILTALSSEEVETALFAALAQGTYQPKGQPDAVRLKVTPDLLDHEIFGDEARVDLYPMYFRAAEVAVGPFLGALVSMYTAHLKKAAPDPAST